MRTVVIGSDHRGVELKNEISSSLKNTLDVKDVSQKNTEEDDYPVVARDVVTHILDGTHEKGILICGSGTGMVIAANRFEGIRCGYAHTVDQVAASVREDDINVLAISADNVSKENALEMIESFMNEEFDGLERHQRRIIMLDAF